jgi:hypothetical protein
MITVVVDGVYYVHDSEFPVDFLDQKSTHAGLMKGWLKTPEDRP